MASDHTHKEYVLHLGRSVLVVRETASRDRRGRRGETEADQDSPVLHRTTGGMRSLTAISSTLAHDVSVFIGETDKELLSRRE